MKRIISLTIALLLMAQVAFAAEFTITVPNGLVDDLVEAFASINGYEEFIDGEPNLQSKVAFAKGCIRGYIKDTYKVWKARTAVKNVVDVSHTQSDTDTINLTVD